MSRSEWREKAERELARLRIERKSRGPRTWIDWLPAEHRRNAENLQWPTDVYERILKEEKVGPMEIWGSERISSFVDGYVTRVREQKKKVDTSDSDDVSSPPSKRRRQGVSERAEEAFAELWKMDFGDHYANPFRTRLTREACQALGMADYYTKVANPVDLSLVRQQLKAGHYADDAMLRKDILLMADNAKIYHPPESPIPAFALQLLQAFDRRLLG